MPIKPYRCPPKVRPVGLVRRDGSIVLEDGTKRGLLGGYPDDPVVIYADRDIVRKYAVKGRGDVIRWNTTWVRWEIGNRSVILLPGFPGDDDDVLAGIVAWRDWLASSGATIGTVGAAATSLLKASLSEPLYVMNGDPPPLGEVIGGRQEPGVGAGYYGPFVAWDLSAAYTRVLGRLCYPAGGWIRVGGELSSEDDPRPAFARCEVTVPDGVAWGPIPRRRRAPLRTATARRIVPRDYPKGKRLRGVWSVPELYAAERAGARIRVRDLWIKSGKRSSWYPFEPWLALIEQGRRLPGYAGALAKMTGNALWGRFIFYGERNRLSWSSGEMEVSDADIPGHAIAAPDLAELVTSSVRARVLDDLLVPYGSDVWSVHTDGGLVDARTTPTLPADWRPKERGTMLIYLGPQAYAWTDDRTEGLHYKLSGVHPFDAPDVFATLRDQELDTGSVPIDPKVNIGKDPYRP